MKKIIIEENGTVYDFSHYLCSEDGKIFNTKNNQWRNPSSDKDGYEYLVLHNEGFKKYFRVHRIVAYLYVKNDDKDEYNIVHHKDGDNKNNHFTNLEWTNVSENTRQGYITGKANQTGSNHSQARLNEEKVIEICQLFREGKTLAAIAKQYGVAPSTIGMIKNRTNWTSVTKDIKF